MSERPMPIYNLRPANIPEELWEKLTDPAVMSPQLPDIAKLGVPPAFDNEEDWDKYASDYKPAFFEGYPHPPQVVLSRCPGVIKLGTPAGHAVQILLISQKWLSPEETGYKFGMWGVDEEILLIPWIPVEQAPESLTFADNTVPVLKSPSTNICDDCRESRFPKKD